MKFIRFIFLFLLFVLNLTTAYSYELVLPKLKEFATTNNYVLFVGNTNTNETLFINDDSIPVASNGAFAFTVKLKEGENRILLRSNYQTQIYKFYKENPTIRQEQQVIDFESKNCTVINDNTPLRSTPVDAGMNRISHLFRGTNLIINGEKEGFYRVFLSKDENAWIKKNDVCINDTPITTPQFVQKNTHSMKNATQETIEFTQKLPYTVEIYEKEILFKVYNPFLSDCSIYTINIPKPEKYNYKVTLDNGKYNIKVKDYSVKDISLKDLTVVVDPGHGGSEYGAIGCLFTKEKDINLQIALELEQLLKNVGVNAILTRNCDGYMSLSDRVELAKNNDADVFISIHLNSIGDIPFDLHKTRGTSVYYFNDSSRELAQALEKSVINLLGTERDGVKTASFAVIRPTDYLGVLIETAYMINPLDTLIYTKEDFAHNTAQGIVDGLVKYFKN